MADFPSTPITGQTYTYGGTTYTWNGEKWVISPGANIQKTNVLPYGENIDLSAGSVHKLTTNVGDYISFANVPAGSSKWTVEIDISNVSKYDISTANGGTPINSLLLAEGGPGQATFRPDGTQLFFVGYSNDRVYSYNLSTPWFISSASPGPFFSVAGADATPYSLAFHPDGTYMYVGGTATDTIYQYALSTPWDVSTSVLYKTKAITQFSVAGPYGLKFKPDGTKMFALSWSATNYGIINEYQLSTAWDVSTATFAGNTPTAYQGIGVATGFDISPNGRDVFIVSGSNVVSAYKFGTPWQANTTINSGVGSFTPAAGMSDANASSVQFNTDGSRMFTTGSTSDTLREYTTSFSGKNYTGTFTFPANVKWAGEAAPTISANTECIIDFYTSDGGTTIYGIPKFNRVI